MAATDPPVATFDDLVRLARTMKAQRPNDPAVDDEVRRLAAATNNPEWQRWLERALIDDQPAPAGRDFWSPAKAFVAERVWGLVKTRGAVALAAVLTGVATAWFARPAPPGAAAEFDAAGSEIEQLFKAHSGGPATFDEVKSILDRHRDKVK